MKVSELEGALLDYWVAKAIGWTLVSKQHCWDSPDGSGIECTANMDDERFHDFKAWCGIRPDTPEHCKVDNEYYPDSYYSVIPCFSTNWSQCGPLIEEYGINTRVHCSENGKPTSWVAKRSWPMPDALEIIGSTPLIAVCRCIVASKYGEEVDAV